MPQANRWRWTTKIAINTNTNTETCWITESNQFVEWNHIATMLHTILYSVAFLVVDRITSVCVCIVNWTRFIVSIYCTIWCVFLCHCHYQNGIGLSSFIAYPSQQKHHMKWFQWKMSLSACRCDSISVFMCVRDIFQLFSFYWRNRIQLGVLGIALCQLQSKLYDWMFNKCEPKPTYQQTSQRKRNSI